MAGTVLSLSVTPKRMLTRAEAAHYCARPVKRFAAECPAAPMRFPNGDERWDIRDLDAWLDAMKGGAVAGVNEIVGRL